MAAWTPRAAWSIEAAGPLLIAVAVLATMWRTALGRIPNGDALTLWVPLWTYLGRTLHAGHLPLWQTNLMSGAPFASDAQSGWGYYEPMVLFTFLSPAHAIRAMLILQPLTAGIALWWFLRSEGLPRFAACCGGLALALAVTESSLVAALPFSGSLAWTAATLGCCSRLFAAETWTRRVIWIVAATVAWGQIAAAHAGLGTLMGSITLITYMAFRVTGLIRSRRWTGTATTLYGLVFGVALAGVNLMFLAPRVAGVGETSLSLGYPQLAALGRVLFGTPAVAYVPGLGAGPGWPLTLASAPGAYLGAAVLFGVWLAFSGRWRSLAWPFITTGVLVYLASLAIVADAIPDGIGQTLIVGLYLHAPYWIGYELVLVLPVLGAIGLASWPDAGTRARRMAVVATAGLLMLLPLLLGVGTRVPIVIAIATIAVVAILWLSDREPRAVWALPLVLLAELALAHVVAVPTTATTALGPIPVNVSPLNHFPLTRPVVLNSSPFQRPVTTPGSGRYILIDSSRAKHDAEPHGTIDGATEPAWFLNWGLVSGARERAGIPRCGAAALLGVRASDGKPGVQLRAHPIHRRTAHARQPAGRRLGGATNPGRESARRDPRSRHPAVCPLPPRRGGTAGVADHELAIGGLGRNGAHLRTRSGIPSEPAGGRRRQRPAAGEHRLTDPAGRAPVSRRQPRLGDGDCPRVPAVAASDPNAVRRRLDGHHRRPLRAGAARRLRGSGRVPACRPPRRQAHLHRPVGAVGRVRHRREHRGAAFGRVCRTRPRWARPCGRAHQPFYDVRLNMARPKYAATTAIASAIKNTQKASLIAPTTPSNKTTMMRSKRGITQTILSDTRWYPKRPFTTPRRRRKRYFGWR